MLFKLLKCQKKVFDLLNRTINLSQNYREVDRTGHLLPSKVSEEF